MNKFEMYGVVGFDIWASDVNAWLAGLESEDVTIRMNSGGGEVYDAVAIYNRLAEYAGNVTIVIDALAASAATIIAMAADEIVMTPSSVMMVHRPWVVAGGTADDLRTSARELDINEDSMVRLYADRTGIDPDKMRAMLDDETWMSAEEAVSLGFADRISRDEATYRDDTRRVAALARYDRFAARTQTLNAYKSRPFWADSQPPIPPTPQANEDKMELEELQKENEELKAKIAAMGEELEELRSQKAEADKGAEEAEAEAAKAKAQAEAGAEAADAEASALQARITALENENVRVELRSHKIDEENFDELVELKRSNAKLYAKTVEILASKVSAVQPPIGRTGDPSANAQLPAEDILAKAKSAGAVYGEGLAVWLHDNHPDRFDEVNAIARQAYMREQAEKTVH